MDIKDLNSYGFKKLKEVYKDGLLSTEQLYAKVKEDRGEEITNRVTNGDPEFKMSLKEELKVALVNKKSFKKDCPPPKNIIKDLDALSKYIEKEGKIKISVGAVCEPSFAKSELGKLLIEHAKNEWSTENVEFVQEYGKKKKYSPKDFNYMYDTYIKSGGSKELNLATNKKERIETLKGYIDNAATKKNKEILLQSVPKVLDEITQAVGINIFDTATRVKNDPDYQAAVRKVAYNSDKAKKVRKKVTDAIDKYEKEIEKYLEEWKKMVSWEEVDFTAPLLSAIQSIKTLMVS